MQPRVAWLPVDDEQLAADGLCGMLRVDDKVHIVRDISSIGMARDEEFVGPLVGALFTASTFSTRMQNMILMTLAHKPDYIDKLNASIMQGVRRSIIRKKWHPPIAKRTKRRFGR